MLSYEEALSIVLEYAKRLEKGTGKTKRFAAPNKDVAKALAVVAEHGPAEVEAGKESREQLEQLTAENAQLTAEKEAATKAAAEAADDAEKRLADLRERCSQLTKEVSKMADLHTAAKAEVVRLTSEKEIAQAATKAAKATAETLEEQVAHSSAAVKDACKQLEEFDKTIKDLTEANGAFQDKLKSAVASAAESEAAMKEELEREKTANADLEATIEKHVEAAKKNNAEHAAAVVAVMKVATHWNVEVPDEEEESDSRKVQYLVKRIVDQVKKYSSDDVTVNLEHINAVFAAIYSDKSTADAAANKAGSEQRRKAIATALKAIVEEEDADSGFTFRLNMANPTVTFSEEHAKVAHLVFNLLLANPGRELADGFYKFDFLGTWLPKNLVDAVISEAANGAETKAVDVCRDARAGDGHDELMAQFAAVSMASALTCALFGLSAATATATATATAAGAATATAAGAAAAGSPAKRPRDDRAGPSQPVTKKQKPKAGAAAAGTKVCVSRKLAEDYLDPDKTFRLDECRAKMAPAKMYCPECGEPQAKGKARSAIVAMKNNSGQSGSAAGPAAPPAHVVSSGSEAEDSDSDDNSDDNSDSDSD